MIAPLVLEKSMMKKHVQPLPWHLMCNSFFNEELCTLLSPLAIYKSCTSLVEFWVPSGHPQLCSPALTAPVTQGGLHGGCGSEGWKGNRTHFGTCAPADEAVLAGEGAEPGRALRWRWVGSCSR